MTVLLNNFAGGTSGTTISAGNSGGASGNAFDVVTIGAGAALAYDNTYAAHGTLAAEVSTGGSSAQSLAAWTTSMGTQAQVWFRQYLYFTANPAGNVPVNGFQQGGTLCARVQVQSTGKLQFLKAAFASAFVTTATIPLNQWFRIEGFVIGDASAGQLELKLFSAADSTTPVETDTSAANLNTAGVMNTYQFGVGSSTANVAAFWMDDVGLSSTGYLGPFAYLYQGQETLDYLDYLDSATGHTLVAAPGGSYLMQVVNSRAGLTVPPPDGRWSQPPGD